MLNASRSSIHRLFALVLVCWIGGTFGLTTGCKRKSPEATPIEKFTLPGAKEVFASISRKEYDKIVGQVAVIQSAATSEADRAQFLDFLGEVKGRLREAPEGDQAAVDTLKALLMFQGGR